MQDLGHPPTVSPHVSRIKVTYICIPGTQMTLVLIGKDIVLEGSTTKIEDKHVLKSSF